MVKNEITNPKLKAQTFKARFLEKGVVKYDDEMVLIKPDNLMAIAMDFKGAHVIIDHQDVAENEANEKIVGYINNVWLGDDGWAWCDFTVNSEEAITLINQGYSVSCAYYPKYAEGGTYHNIPFDREIVGGEAIHLAIVKNPRYEDAIILKNSINKIMTIFKFKKSKENSAEVKEIELENAMFEIEEGENVSVAEMVEAYKNSKKNEKEEEKENECEPKVNADDEYEVDGEMIKVSELASAYKASKKKNEAEEESKKKEEAENEAKEEKEKEEAKKNSADAEKIEASKKKFENGSESLTNSKVMTDRSRFDLGKSLYGAAQPVSK